MQNTNETETLTPAELDALYEAADRQYDDAMATDWKYKEATMQNPNENENLSPAELDALYEAALQQYDDAMATDWKY